MRAQEADAAAADVDAVGSRMECGGVLVGKHHTLLSIKEDDGDRTAIQKLVQRLDDRQHRGIKRHRWNRGCRRVAFG